MSNLHVADANRMKRFERRMQAAVIAPIAACFLTQAASTGLRAAAMNPPTRTETSRRMFEVVTIVPSVTSRSSPWSLRLPPETAWMVR